MDKWDKFRLGIMVGMDDGLNVLFCTGRLYLPSSGY